MKKVHYFLFATLLTFQLTSGVYEEAVKDYKVDTVQTHILEMAKSLPMTGVLKIKENGYAYLDVSNEYITKLFPNLILDGHLRPTHSFGSEEGAHITVVSDKEEAQGIENELGKSFTFTIKELRVIEVTKTYYETRYDMRTTVSGYRWVLAVESDELEELRIQYGLSPLLNRHDFHITIGFEVPFCRINNFGERPPPPAPY